MAKEESKSLFDEAKETLEQTIGDRMLLAKMETAEKVALISGKLILFTSASIFLFFALFFLSLMAGYYFAEVFESLFAGFALVALFYVLLSVLVFVVGRKYLVPKIESSIIETIFNDDPK
ncbi:MAG TPA: phage holin family protein [Phnomibacter sp.]|nr:phage holin family protein [Phnomibacter sp.]